MLDRQVASAFRKAIERENLEENEGYAQYITAHRELQILMVSANNGNVIPAEEIDRVKLLFDLTRFSAEKSGDLALELRCQMYICYLPLMVYADGINHAPLSAGESRRVRERFDLAGIHAGLCEQAGTALEKYDILCHTPKDERNDDETSKIGNLTGLLQEQSFHILYSAHRTLKIFSTPASYFDDALTPKTALRTDAYLYDNRKSRSHNKYPAQIKSASIYSRPDRRVALVTMRDMANVTKHSLWFPSEKPFETVRMAILRQRDKVDDPKILAKLDSVKQSVLDKVFGVELDGDAREVVPHYIEREDPMVKWMRNRTRPSLRAVE